ncbi:MAG: hypothetical protein WD076_12245, partial [Parvularculaceae bacterium]
KSLRIQVLLVSLAGVALLAATATATAGEGKTAYAPLKAFEPYAGKVWRGEGKDPEGKPVVDIADWEFILGGRALQVTHSIGEGQYGGRTIYFFDEGARKYLFHYFTTAGFHSEGEIVLREKGFEAIELVKGHPQITEVRGEVRPTKDGFEVSSRYLAAGVWEKGHGFTYVPYVDGPPSFVKTSTTYGGEKAKDGED